MTPLEYRRQNKLIDSINAILVNHGIAESIDLRDVTITGNTVSDFATENQILSNLIVNNIWPSIDHQTVYHYTSKDSAESILNSGEFRFYSLLKRFNEDEIKKFCENHGLTGYLEQDENREPKYKSLIMKNIFYASFTDANITTKQEGYFWRTFGAIDGVRLTLDIEASNLNFRKIVYEEEEGAPIALLKNLTTTIRESYGLEFLLSGISRLCAFYLSKDFDVENEYRALYKYQEGSESQPKADGAYQYIELPLGCMNDIGYKITVTEIQTNESLDIPCKYHVTPRNT